MFTVARNAGRCFKTTGVPPEGGGGAAALTDADAADDAPPPDAPAGACGTTGATGVATAGVGSAGADGRELEGGGEGDKRLGERESERKVWRGVKRELTEKTHSQTRRDRQTEREHSNGA